MAGTTIAAAAGLVAMAVRFSDDLEEGPARLARVEVLRARLGDLVDADGPAYAAVLEAARRSRDDPGRDAALRDALTRATDVPLAMVEHAAEVAELGAEVAERGNPNLRGDAVVAVVLAEAGARAARSLVAANVRHGGLAAERRERADAWCAAARRVRLALDPEA